MLKKDANPNSDQSYESTGIFRKPEDIAKAINPPKPVSILEWATSPDYCGKVLFPWERIQLKALYCLDFTPEEKKMIDEQIALERIPENIYDKIKTLKEQGREFEILVLVEGRRSGKTFLTSIILSYEIYRLIQKDDPQAYYGIDPGTIIYVVVGAKTVEQAKATIYPIVYRTILDNKWFANWIVPDGVKDSSIFFQTPNDRRIQKILKETQNVNKAISSVRLVLMGSNAAPQRGKSILCFSLTEYAWFLEGESIMSDRAAWDAIEPATRDMKTRGSTKLDRKIITESTPWTKSGMFYELFLQSHGIVQTEEGDKVLTPESHLSTLSFKLPTWVANPNHKLEDFDADFETDPDRAAIEWGAEFADDVAFYLNHDKIDAMFDAVLTEKDKGAKGALYEAHGDPSERRANFPVCVAHKEGDIVVVDKLTVFKPKDFDGEIDYDYVTNYFIDLCTKFNIHEFTFDQYSSIMIIQKMQRELKKKNIRTIVRQELATQASNKRRYDVLKESLYQGKIQSYYHNQLDLELKHLINKRGRIDHPPSGPVTTKDCADALSEVVRRLMESKGSAFTSYQPEGGLSGLHPRIGQVSFER